MVSKIRISQYPLKKIIRPVLFSAPFLLFLWNSLYFFPWTVDDAFISMRYAQNLVDGNGLVYNPGERVEGYSNFSLVLLEAGLIRLNIPLLTSLKAIGLISGTSLLLMAYFLVRRLADADKGRLAGNICLWYLAFNTSLALWCQSGLETTFFAAIIFAMCFRFEVELDSKKRFPWSAVLFALAWMTRPEAPVYSLFFVIRRISAWRRPQRNDYLWLILFAVFIVPYEIWGLAYYGKFFPLTHTAKILTWSLKNLQDVWSYFFLQGPGYSVILILAFIGIFVFRRGLSPVIWVPILSGLIFAGYAHTDWMPGYRLFIPIIAFQGCFIAVGISEFFSLKRSRPVLLTVLMVVILAGGINYSIGQITGSFQSEQEKPFPRAIRGKWWWLEVPNNLNQRKWPLEMAAIIILAHTPRGERVVTKDIGFPGFLTMMPIWDMIGLVTPSSADLHHRMEDSEVRDRYVGEFIQSGRGALILIPPLQTPFIALQETLLTTHPDLRNFYQKIETPKMDQQDPKRFARIVLGIPPGNIHVWKHRKLANNTPKEIYENLEQRLDDVVLRFPEYGPRASSILNDFKEYLQRESDHLP